MAKMNAALHRPTMPQVETIFSFDGVISEFLATSGGSSNMFVPCDAHCMAKRQHAADVIQAISTSTVLPILHSH
jgi:hypothetical protein